MCYIAGRSDPTGSRAAHASAAGQTLEWLAGHRLTDLLQRTVAVLNDSDGHADNELAVLAQQFANHGLVVIEVPLDPHLRPGGVIDVSNEMSAKTRRRFYEIVAAIADHFASTTRHRASSDCDDVAAGDVVAGP